MTRSKNKVQLKAIIGSHLHRVVAPYAHPMQTLSRLKAPIHQGLHSLHSLQRVFLTPYDFQPMLCQLILNIYIRTGKPYAPYETLC